MGITEIVWKFIKKFFDDMSTTYASALAYNLLLAIIPLVVAIISFVGFIFGNQVKAQQKETLQSIASIFPEKISNDVLSTFFNQLAHFSGVVGIISFLIAIIIGSRLFILLESGFSVVYRKAQRGIVMQNLMAFGMILLFFVLLPLTAITSGYPSIFLNIVSKSYGTRSIFTYIIIGVFGIAMSIFISFIFFIVIYLFVPNIKTSINKVWKGALFASIGLQLYLEIFPIYSKNFFIGYVGYVGFVIILLIFFFYFSVLIFLGAQINAFFEYGITDSAGPITTIISTVSGKSKGNECAGALKNKE